MQVKLTKTLNEKKGYVAGTTFDWPRNLIRKLREDYGDDVLEPVGQEQSAIKRMQARAEALGRSKPPRQARLGMPAQLAEDALIEPSIETVAPRRGRRRDEEPVAV